MPLKITVAGRPDESGYDLWYGRKAANITLFAEKQPNGKFKCPELFEDDTRMLKDIKAAFEVWGANQAVERKPTTHLVAQQPVKLERDPVCDGEAAFFRELSVLRRRLTDNECRALRDITNYLTGMHAPVNVQEDTDESGSNNIGDNSIRVQSPAPSGPPPFRPRVSGPPVYSKPPRTGRQTTADDNQGEHTGTVPIPDSSEAGELPGE